MNVALPMLMALVALAAAYRFYGRRAGRWLGIDPNRPTPAVTHRDGVDYMPANPFLLFGHHYASIAAAGPIVGPTIAMGFGFLPTWLWILFGVAFLGAIHDLVALFMSVRTGGQSVAETTLRVLGKTGFGLFLAFALILCVLVSAAFLDLTALALSSTYPLEALGLSPAESPLRIRNIDGVPHAVVGGVASTSMVVMTAFAPVLGWLVYRRQISTWLAVWLSLGVSLVSVVVGLYWPLTVDPTIWVMVIATYSLVAGFIPVWLMIQPRDFTNVQFLYLGIVAMVLGILACGLHGVQFEGPAFVKSGPVLESLGAMWPTLFVTVACGSISGAHALIAGGTTSKQIANERHIVPIGYGGMLGEALLAICVTLVLMAGLGANEYDHLVWPLDEHGHLGQGNAPLAFAAGVGGTLYKGFGLPPVYGTLFGILLLEGFLVTTVDTIVRLSRYLLEEFWSVTLGSRRPRILRSRVVNTLIPISAILLFALNSGYKTIWPVFGTANQLLAALTLTTAALWLRAEGRRVAFVAFPAGFMLITTFASLAQLLAQHFRQNAWPLLITDITLTVLALTVAGLALHRVYRSRSVTQRAGPA
jgi:carbon starvation protein